VTSGGFGADAPPLATCPATPGSTWKKKNHDKTKDMIFKWRYQTKPENIEWHVNKDKLKKKFDFENEPIVEKKY